MSLSFKNNVEEMQANSLVSETFDRDYKAIENYDTASHVRNLCFVWPNGSMKFMNYAYLVSGEYSPSDGKVFLTFTSEKIILEGINLKGLFVEISQHKSSRITCSGERYKYSGSDDDIVITNINIS